MEILICTAKNGEVKAFTRKKKRKRIGQMSEALKQELKSLTKGEIVMLKINVELTIKNL